MKKRKREYPGNPVIDRLAALATRTPAGLVRRAAVSLVLRAARRLSLESVSFPGDWGRMAGDPQDHVLLPHYAVTGRWEAGLVNLLAGSLKSGGGTFLDIGANIGLISVPLARIAGARVEAFEPDPALAALLRHNLRVNAPTADARVHALALADWTGRGRLHRCAFNRGDNWLVPERGPAGSGRMIETAVRPLDGLIDADALRPPVVIKIDAQGAEHRILAGGRRVFSRAAAIALEYWPLGIRRFGGNPRAFLQEISSGFDRAVLMMHGHEPNIPAPRPLREILSAAERMVGRGEESDLVNIVLLR